MMVILECRYITRTVCLRCKIIRKRQKTVSIISTGFHFVSDWILVWFPLSVTYSVDFSSGVFLKLITWAAKCRWSVNPAQSTRYSSGGRRFTRRIRKCGLRCSLFGVRGAKISPAQVFKAATGKMSASKRAVFFWNCEREYCKLRRHNNR